jgi:hypothetical protein
MAVTMAEIFRRLRQCKLDQLTTIEVEFDLPREYLDVNSVAARAKDILDLLKQRRDKRWIDRLMELLNRLQTGAEPYLGGRLEHLQRFLLGSRDTENVSPETVGTIKELREKLKQGKGLDSRDRVLIRVRGTLFPAALLTEGWWERKQLEAGSLTIEWANPLQQWLFRGFDLWAPSWDVCWGATDPNEPAKRYHIAQLTEGDEADSLPVIIGPRNAEELRAEFQDSWGGFEAVVVGRLGHRFHFDKVLPKNVKRDPHDYYISVEDDNRRHKITRLKGVRTDLYSGYLWKLVAPEEWVKNEPMLGLNQVYFVWEHTNFVAKEAVQYNLEGLEHKERLIARQHPGSKLILLQKSHEIVPGEPAWPMEKFYQLYLLQGKEIGG